MWTRWQRWNWGLQQSSSRKSRLSQEPQNTTHSLHLTRLAVARQLTAGRYRCRVSNTTVRKALHSLCFKWPACYRKQHGERKPNGGPEQRNRQRESQSYFSCAIRRCGQWKWCVFSVVECGQCIRLPGEQQPAASHLQIPVDSTAHESDGLLCLVAYPLV